MFLLTNSNFLKTTIMFLNYLYNVNFLVYKQFKNIFDIMVLIVFKNKKINIFKNNFLKKNKPTHVQDAPAGWHPAWLAWY